MREPTMFKEDTTTRTFHQEDLKLGINNLIWMFANENLTLKQADELSLRILNLFHETVRG